MRQATGYIAHPAYFAPKAPHLLKGADGYRTTNEKLDELRLAVQKICRCLQDEGQLSSTALAPLPGASPLDVHTIKEPRLGGRGSFYLVIER